RILAIGFPCYNQDVVSYAKFSGSGGGNYSRPRRIGACRNWQPDKEGRPLADFAFQPDFAVVHGDVFPDNRQTQTRTGCGFYQILILVTEEAIPDAVMLIFGNADARIGDFYRHPAGICFSSEGYRSPRVGVVEGIVRQIREHLANLVSIGADQWQILRDRID